MTTQRAQEDRCPRCETRMLYDDGPFCLVHGHFEPPVPAWLDINPHSGYQSQGGRGHRRTPRTCAVCGVTYQPTYYGQRACNRVCGQALSAQTRERNKEKEVA